MLFPAALLLSQPPACRQASPLPLSLRSPCPSPHFPPSDRCLPAILAGPGREPLILKIKKQNRELPCPRGRLCRGSPALLQFPGRTTRPRRWADLLALPRGSGPRGHGLTLEGARVPELQALAGLGHTLLCCLLTSTRHPLVVRRCVSLPQCPRAHVCIRIAAESCTLPGVPDSVGLGWGPRICISHKSLGDAGAPEFFKVLGNVPSEHLLTTLKERSSEKIWLVVCSSLGAV